MVRRIVTSPVDQRALTMVARARRGLARVIGISTLLVAATGSLQAQTGTIAG